MKAYYSQLKEKKRNKLVYIPHNKLFVSEGGDVYDIDEIVDFINGRQSFFSYTKNSEEKTHKLCDFKNTEKNYIKKQAKHSLTPIFNENDLLTLMGFSEVRTAFENTPCFEELQNLSLAFHDSGTLDILKCLAKENSEKILHSDQLPKLRENLIGLKKHVKRMFDRATALNGVLEDYQILRDATFTEDILEMASSKDNDSCDFLKAITLLSNTLENHYNFAMAIKRLDELQQTFEQEKDDYSKSIFAENDYDGYEEKFLFHYRRS